MDAKIITSSSDIHGYDVHPPLGVEVICEFQEFQEVKTTQSNFKRRKRVAKIKRRKMFVRRAFILFRTQPPHHAQ